MYLHFATSTALLSDEDRQSVIETLQINFALHWNPSIAATVREWHFGCYMEVAYIQWKST